MCPVRPTKALFDLGFVVARRHLSNQHHRPDYVQALVRPSKSFAEAPIERRDFRISQWLRFLIAVLFRVSPMPFEKPARQILTA